MQSLTQMMKSGPKPAEIEAGQKPVTTENTQQPLENETGAQPVESETETQVVDSHSALSLESETVITPDESEKGVQLLGGETLQTPGDVTATQALEMEPAVEPVSDPSHNTGGTGMDTTSKPSAPTELVPDVKHNPDCDAQGASKVDKVVPDRKYIPCKKDRMDPLKMDMSKPVVMPLTSSQLSLQCIECHIIFSDHKSKERHLKLSHPAEYEQCILRNALFACYVCDRHFTNSTELMAHQKAHIEKKPFKCPICSQAFNKSSELTLHKKIHFGRDGYACADCGKPCKTLTLLKYHRRTHTGERPYVCKECGKRFSMSKALQKHMMSHLPEDAEEDGGDTSATAKAQLKKNNGTTVKYPCSVCKATFKTTKTRLHHMKTKHNLLPAATTNAIQAGQPVKEGIPIITPISICQPALLQMEPIGPLQQVDANIDTEQIRKLIESLGNVQKVNQVVILGQVPPNAPPLELQQISEPVNLNLTPSQVDLVEQTEFKTVELEHSKNPCESMEQTIILEPITPDGQLENPSFSELGSHIATSENIGLTLVETEQTERHQGEMMHEIFQQPETGTVQSDSVNQIVCQSEVVDLKQNLEQTVILEFTSAFMPTVELEQSQSVPQSEMPSSSLVPSTELEKISDETVLGPQETNLSVPPLMPTVELELTPLQTDQQDLPACPFVPADAFTQTPVESEANPKAEADSEIQTVGLDPVHSVRDEAPVEETHKKTQQEQSENLLVDQNQEQIEKSEVDDPPAEKEVSQLQTEQVQQPSHIAINAMSAQELVKVRKRKPARTFIFQENMHELVGTTQKDDVEIDAKPAKRQRTKKSRLVVKFGPQNKERQNKKQKKHSQPCHSTQEEPLKGKSSTTNLSSKKVPSQKKGRKAKKGKKEGLSVSMAEIKSTSSTHNSQVQQIKVDVRKNKMKRKKDVVSDDVEHISEQEIVVSPVFKKKKQPKILQKSQPKKTKDGKLTSKERKKKTTKEQKMNTEISTVSANIPDPQITRDSLLLLKGHKQPQLKVHKLDPAKASGQTQEALPHKLQTTSQLSNDITLKQRNKTTNTSGNKLTTGGGKKKGGRPKKNQKTLSLLSSLQVSTPPSETLPSKPKTTRKRKASLKVETEGVITSSHSRRALECKDCGERFSEVSSLQEHKTTAHVVESPGLTYTNGNIFEGVSRLDLGQPAERHDEPIGVMNAATGWDTEAEMGEIALEERERSVSFPALNPSPSLPATAPDVEASGYEDKSGNTAAAEITPFMGIAKELPEQASQCLSPPEVVSPYPSNADQKKMLESNSDAPPHFTSKAPLNISTQTKGSEAGGPLGSVEDKSVYQSSRQDITKSPLLPGSESEIQGTTDEDIKEGLLLEVDLVTVGEQNERDDLTLAQDSGSQSKHAEPTNPESSSTDTCVPPGQIDNETTTEKSLTSQTVSCSTHEPEIKEEEEEILVQRKEEGMKSVVRKSVTRGRRRGTGRLKKAVVSRKSSVCDDGVRGKEPEKDMDECQIVYQSCPLTSNSEINDEGETSTLHHTLHHSQSSQPEISPAPATSVPSIPSSLEESPEKQVVFELESVATSVVEVTKSEERPGLEGAKEQDRDTGQSPGIILERFVASRQRETGDKEHGLPAIRNNERQGLDGAAENEVVFREVPRGQEIKVEENISDPPLVAHTCQSRQRVVLQPQHQHDIRTVLVKQETSLVLNDTQATHGGRHIRWNVEQINTENTSGPLLENEEMTRDSGVAPDFNTNQCIFYPVKEEEREVLLGASQGDSGALTVGVSSNASIGHDTDGQHQPASNNLHEASHATEDYQETTVRGVLSRAGVNNFENTAAEADGASEDTAELRDFLLQSSDNEDSDVLELPDPQLEAEAEAMACYYKDQNSSPPQPDEMSHNSPTSDSHLHSRAQREGNGSREPIDYFSKYFGWDTWVEIAQCTNKQSNMLNPVTAKEVARFVGIHIAMGTLKFPSLKLYWQDFTKVPLIAEAMPLSQFLQLSHKLKLACPAKDPVSSIRVERHDHDMQNAQQTTTITGAMSSSNNCRNGQISLLSDGQSQQGKPNELSLLSTQTDPLWRVQPVLRRFRAGCQLLSQEGDYAVDQYPLPLTTRKANNDKFSLHCTTLIGFGGLILHLDLKLDLADKEDAVEKMVPRGSMVFLCKQELSTPAMLERLLVAGVHGAGRVGGARGQIGDEFVSSDGKLMLRRSDRGFILSTVGYGQRNMGSLIDNFEKAQMSARLNRDLQNLYRIPLTASAPTCWPQAVLWYLTDLALVNAWLLYRQDQGPASEPLTLMAFRLEVCKALILSSGSDTQDSVPPQPPTQKAHTTSETPNPNLLEESPLPDAATRYDGSGHWPEQLGEGEGGRCRFGGCERTSRVLCLKCCVFLCISRNHNCFLNFHNQGSLGNE